MERVALARLLGARELAAVPRDVVVEASTTESFIALFRDAVAAGGTVFLADPTWGERERAQFAALVKQVPDTRETMRGERGWLCIPTGGSSGAIKLARHDQATLAAAVAGFGEYFGVSVVNAVGVLPLYHISGFMAWMRTVLTGGAYVHADWKAVEGGERPVVNEGVGGGFLSLVPTQLQRLLGDEAAETWLREFLAVFIGGGPAWPALLESGRRARLPLSFSYGMTETAAMVAALKPEAFFAGGEGSGQVLPHARVAVGEGGRLTLQSASLFRGYWPLKREDAAWETDDVGAFDASGSLHITGRRDALIITGGKKVDPAEVEQALRASGQFGDVAVVGVADLEWGEKVVAVYPAEMAAPDLAFVRAQLTVALSGYKHPKAYVSIAHWPRNAQGKVNRAELRRAASEA
jgi:o-succinylbenzoate---CoA ligase